MDEIDRLAGEVRAAESVVALTGAGVSTASGIPDFRGEDGIWTRYDPGDFHYRRFRSDPGGFWTDRLDLHAELFGADPEPNAAHDALAGLAADGHLDALCTQNTDGLHAGINAELIELHGNASRAVCVDCGRRAPDGEVVERVRAGETPPRCECSGLLKPDVVLFGEQLDPGTLSRARALAREADVFLAAGSSLSVEPVASLPGIAADAGATLAVVNLEETPYAGHADYDLRADVTDTLPALRAAVG